MTNPMGVVLAAGFFVTANYIEAALWGVMGTGFLLHAILKHGGKTSTVTAFAFFLFAASDLIETRTGAWWRPWWLLVLKGGCVGTFALLLTRHYVGRKDASANAGGACTPGLHSETEGASTPCVRADELPHS